MKTLQKPMSESDKALVNEYMISLAQEVTKLLPPGQVGFIIILTEEASPGGTQNFVSNISRSQAPEILREVAKKLERGSL